MRIVAAFAVFAAACGGGGKPDAAPSAAPAATATGAAQPLVGAVTPTARADSVSKPVGDSAKRGKAAAPAEEKPLRDSAMPPKFTVDEKGKVAPIKKPN